jgi:hypothetical protein
VGKRVAARGQRRAPARQRVARSDHPNGQLLHHLWEHVMQDPVRAVADLISHGFVRTPINALPATTRHAVVAALSCWATVAQQAAARTRKRRERRPRRHRAGLRTTTDENRDCAGERAAYPHRKPRPDTGPCPLRAELGEVCTSGVRTITALPACRETRQPRPLSWRMMRPVGL